MLSYNKTIWMCWFQGVENLSENNLNKKCIKRWKELNPDWDVNVLSSKTVIEYAPELTSILKDSPDRSIQSHSDLLRLLLLNKFGGVWVDCSVYPMYPLSKFYNKIVNNTGFFAYRFNPRGSYDARKKCEIASWFLCVDRPNHPLIKKWKKNFIKNFKTFKWWPYFTLHETLTDLYDSDWKIKEIINNMIQINQTIPHSAIKKREESCHYIKFQNSFMYKNPDFKILDENLKQEKNKN